MDESVLEDEEFEKLLDSFINSEFENDQPEENKSLEDKKLSLQESKDAILNNSNNVTDDNNDEDNYDDENDELLNNEEMSEDEIEIRNEVLSNDPDSNLYQDTDVTTDQSSVETPKQQPILGPDEAELAQAFVNYSTAINTLSEENLHKPFVCSFDISSLYPNYKPSIGAILSEDVIEGWVKLVKMYPKEFESFSLTSSDEEFLDFAEKIQNQNLQLAIISYVEIMIDMEGCEISYATKLVKHQEKFIKKIMYEEYLERKERQRKFTEALAKKNFPIDADKLIANYFRVAQKDVDGAFRALTTNPAIFAPIDYSKIKPRFFGLIKVSPRDGIKINANIGNFLKKLKV